MLSLVDLVSIYKYDDKWHYNNMLDFDKLSENPNIPIDYMAKNYKLGFCWVSAGSNLNLTIDHIHKYIYFPWRLKYIIPNPNIRIKDIHKLIGDDIIDQELYDDSDEDFDLNDNACESNSGDSDDSDDEKSNWIPVIYRYLNNFPKNYEEYTTKSLPMSFIRSEKFTIKHIHSIDSLKKRDFINKHFDSII